MITININDAIAQMPDLFAKVLAGEKVVLCENTVPMIEMRQAIEIKPLIVDNNNNVDNHNQKNNKRILGNPPFPMVIPDSFFDPLPDDLLDAFEGKNSVLI